MGREIRRVPANWEHPKKETFDFRTARAVKNYQPLFDEPFGPAMEEWYAGWKAWDNGTDPDREGHDMPYWEWHGGPPDPVYYRPDWKPEHMTWWQVYETVSEGTPVTPPFATPDELVDYLATHGDFWDQQRLEGAWPRANAESFVKRGWSPSMIVTTSAAGVDIRTARDGA